jgi:SAM-dependent MidA family methyltransferase
MKTQKVTVHVDQDLLQRAQERTGKGVSATIRQGLTLVAASGVSEKLKRLRGRVRFSDLRVLREDRR